MHTYIYVHIYIYIYAIHVGIYLIWELGGLSRGCPRRAAAEVREKGRTCGSSQYKYNE